MGVNVKGLQRQIDNASPRKVMKEIANALEEALKEGEQQGKAMISSRGTNREWSRSWNGRTRSGAGRVDTGRMRDEFEGGPVEVRGERATGVLGWQDGSPEYAKFQEHGFRHILAQRDIQGMHALRDAGELTEKAIERNLEGVADAIFN